MRQLSVPFSKYHPSCRHNQRIGCRQSQLQRLEAERSSLIARVSELEQEKATRVDEAALAALRETSSALEQRYRDSVRRITELERRVNELEIEAEKDQTQCVNMQM